MGADAPQPQSDRAAAQRILRHYQREREETRRRELLLRPNLDDKIFVERYTMGVEATNPDGTPTIVIIGPDALPQALFGSQAPACDFRPQRLTTNSPGPGCVTLSMAKVANVNFIVGGAIDAWQWNANAWEEELDIPTLTPANNASFAGNYIGKTYVYIPNGGHDINFQFVMSASGPALMTGLIEDDLVSEPV